MLRLLGDFVPHTLIGASPLWGLPSPRPTDLALFLNYKYATAAVLL